MPFILRILQPQQICKNNGREYSTSNTVLLLVQQAKSQNNLIALTAKIKCITEIKCFTVSDVYWLL